jgi:predicted phosphodiesterase
MHAIISDIHSNVEALEAVLEDIRSQDIDEILCLGDVVGYGPDPEVCIDIVEKECRFCLSGNHDYATLTKAERFNPLAEEAIDYTRNRLKPAPFKGDWYKKLVFARSRLEQRWTWLEQLFLEKRERDVLYVHGSPRDPRNEYILETDVTFGNVEKIEEIFTLTPRACFVGHSHVPGIIQREAERKFDYQYPVDFENVKELEEDKKYVINVGSVGQPRDGDPRACYVILEDGLVRFRRVEYSVERTVEKIYAVTELDNFLGDRLRDGR